MAKIRLEMQIEELAGAIMELSLKEREGLWLILATTFQGEL